MNTHQKNIVPFVSVLTLLVLLAAGCQPCPGTKTTLGDSKAAARKGGDAPGKAWESLFDGKTLGKWKKTKFGGEGEVGVKDGAIFLEMGNDLTGIHWPMDAPYHKMNYEIELEGQRFEGGDFFVGLTFPVNDKNASLICGGWGGTVVGISSLDGFDASENETAVYKDFKPKVWYRFRLRVTEKRIEAWIDNELMVEADIEGRKISVRPEVELSIPLGFCTWRTTGVLRNIRVRKLTEAELAAYRKEK